MTLLNLLTNAYPASLYEVRQANPNVSFPAEPTDEDLAPFGHVNVHPTPQPSYDPRTQRIEAPTAVPDADGVYRQQWAVRDATDDEIAAYDEANPPAPPAPDWAGFAVALILDPPIQAWFNALPQAIANGLSVGLNEVSKSNPGMFLRLWSELTPTIPAAVPLALATLAEQHHLPSDFIGALSAAPAAGKVLGL
jgi:hypothetical protein